MSKKRIQKNRYQKRPKSFTPPRQLGISLKYAKLIGTDERFSSIYKEIDIELRSFAFYNQEGKTNGNYFRLTENKDTLETFNKLKEAEKSFIATVSNRVDQGWTMIKGNELFVS